VNPDAPWNFTVNPLRGPFQSSKTARPIVVGAAPKNSALASDEQSKNAQSPIVVTLAGIITLVSPLPENARLPILVTPEEIVTLLSDRQELNAETPMAATPEGIVTSLSPLPENAKLPIVATLEGIVTVASAGQLQNAWLPMPVTPSGIVTLVIPSQFLNAESPMPVTVLLSMIEGITRATSGTMAGPSILIPVPVSV
jgi:hypothetical protein